MKFGAFSRSIFWYAWTACYGIIIPSTHLSALEARTKHQVCDPALEVVWHGEFESIEL